jgi:hypothetical protein
MQEINLINLGGGAVAEKFGDELSKVVENILDPNTEPKVKREVTIKVVIRPTIDRDMGAIAVYASSKLAPPVAFITQAYFGKDGQRSLAFENNPNQFTFNDFIETEKENNVHEIMHSAERKA